MYKYITFKETKDCLKLSFIETTPRWINSMLAMDKDVVFAVKSMGKTRLTVTRIGTIFFTSYSNFILHDTQRWYVYTYIRVCHLHLLNILSSWAIDKWVINFKYRKNLICLFRLYI